MGPVKKLWRSKKLSGASRMRGRVIMCRYNPSLITQYTAIHFTLRQELGWWPRLMRHPWLCSMQRVYLCLMPQYLLSAITIVYWVFTHSITPPPASPSRVIYQSGARTQVLMRDLCKLSAVMAGAGHKTPGSLIILRLLWTSHIIIITSLSSSLWSSLWSSPGAG